MEKPGFYNREGVPQVEIERLEKIGFPNRVSESILDNYDLQEQKILDVGAGANPELGRYIAEKGGRYIALDIRHEMLTRLKGNSPSETFLGIVGKTQELPVADKSIDFVHQRFVLMHLPPSDRPKAIQELIRVAKKGIVLLEWNWRSMTSTSNPAEIEKFRTLNFELMNRMNVEPYMGEQLADLIKTVDSDLEITVESRNEGEGDNTKELIALCEVGAQMATLRLGDGKLANQFADLAIELSGHPIRFTRPDIGVAQIKL